MSDELIKSLNGRIAQLEQDKASLKVALNGARKDLKRSSESADTAAAELAKAQKKYQTDLESLAKDRDEFKAKLDSAPKADDLAKLTNEIETWKSKATAAPDDKDATISELQNKIRSRDFRDEFTKHIGDNLAPGFSVEDLWHYAEFDPAKVEALDDKAISEVVGKVRQAKPGIFAPPAATGNSGTQTTTSGTAQGTARQPLKVAAEAGRGARDTASGQVSYRLSDLRSPTWQKDNPTLAKAMQDGNAVPLDD